MICYSQGLTGLAADVENLKTKEKFRISTAKNRYDIYETVVLRLDENVIKNLFTNGQVYLVNSSSKEQAKITHINTAELFEQLDPKDLIRKYNIEYSVGLEKFVSIDQPSEKSSIGQKWEEYANDQQPLKEIPIEELNKKRAKDNADLFYQSGLAKGNRGEFDEALLDFNSAIELDKNHAEAYNHRGIIWARFGNLNQSIADFGVAIHLKSTYADAYNNRAVSYYHTKEYDKAWEDVHAMGRLGTTVHPDFLRMLKEATGRDQ